MVGKPMAAAVRPRNWRREEVRGWRFMVVMRWGKAWARQGWAEFGILQGSCAGVKGFR